MKRQGSGTDIVKSNSVRSLGQLYCIENEYIGRSGHSDGNIFYPIALRMAYILVRINNLRSNYFLCKS